MVELQKTQGRGGIGVGKKYVQQLPQLGVAELIRKFNEAPLPLESKVRRPEKSTILNDIGIYAVKGCQESSKTLVGALNHSESDVRYVAATYLGDFLKKHPLMWKAYKAVKKFAKREQNQNVRDMACRAEECLKKRLRC